MRRWNTDESLRRLERAAATGAKDDRVRLAVARIRAGEGPERRLREILEEANQATFTMGHLIGLDVTGKTDFMALPFESLRELVTITAGDPAPRLFAHAAMPVRAQDGGLPYPVTLALAVRDVERDVVTVGVITTGTPWSAPNDAGLSGVAWWTYRDRTPSRGSISDRQREERVWVMPEINAYPGSLRRAPAGRLTQIVLDWARRDTDPDPYAGSGITFPIRGLRVNVDLSEAELWSARRADEATTDERIEVSSELWRIRNRGPAATGDYLTNTLADRPRVQRFALDYARQWANFGFRLNDEPPFPGA